MDRDGGLKGESAVRAAKAAAVYKERHAGILVTCGWAYRKDCKITLAEAFSRHISENFGIVKACIISQDLSRDTVGDAYFTKISVAIPLNIKTIIIVTSSYHVERAREIFDFIYANDALIEVVGVNVSTVEDTFRRERASLDAFRATFTGVERGNNNAILQRIRERHPYYNGDVYPQLS